jgi:glycosyltransferase involved in cell wall biosynthesis
LFPKKGLDLTIPAFARLVAQYPQAFLLIAGDDAGSGYRAELERLAEVNGIGSRIHFLGEVRGQRKFQILRSVDAFVLSSYSEGLPVAVLEAMACSCPVVVTRHCHINEVENRETGWLVESNVDSVLEGLGKACLSAQERRRRGRNARRLVEERYTWDRIARESIHLYRSVQARTN